MARDPEVRDLLIASVKLIVQAEVVLHDLRKTLAQLTDVVIPHLEQVPHRRATDIEGGTDA